MNWSWISGCALALVLTGCTVKPLPDPNDPNQAGLMQADVLRRNIKAASDMISDRVGRGEISDARGRQILEDHVAKLLDGLHVEQIPQNKAWEYADAYLTARRWDQAEKMLAIALKNPPNEDRRVNDTLRLAHCEAELGRVDHAIELTRSTFNADTRWKWPILYATYLEIGPAALRTTKGYDLKIARLVEDAIHQHEQATGSAANEAESGWLATRAFHIRQAWLFIGKIYRAANREDLAREAEKRQSETVKAVRV